MERTRIQTKKLLRYLSSADLVFFLLPPLMILLVAGTLAQKYMGLYEAQNFFFSTFLIWLGPVPLPGGYLLIGLLTLSLLFKFLFFSEWRWKKSGVLLAHLGVLILLAGGLISALSVRENFMMVGEGNETPYVYDYFNRALFVFENGALAYTLPANHLETALEQTSLPFSINVLARCQNCAIEKRENAPQDFGGVPLQGMAQFMALLDVPPEKESEANLGGVTLSITGVGDKDGVYLAFEGMPQPISFQTGVSEYKIIFGKVQDKLPFSIRLNDFRKYSYPGTDKARAYSSDVVVIDNGVETPYTIEMNKPLRYRGYTFYQSSFEKTDIQEIAIFTVVENKGRLYPYISTGVIAFGLILHLMMMSRVRRRT